MNTFCCLNFARLRVILDPRVHSEVLGVSLWRRGEVGEVLGLRVPGPGDRCLCLAVVSPGVWGEDGKVQLLGEELPGAGPQGDAAVQVLGQQPPQPRVLLE